MIFLYIVAAIAALLILAIVFSPRKYRVERSIVINKPIEEVFAYLKSIKNQDEWSPWKKRDPDMQQHYTGTDGTVGFVAAWDSEHKNVGAGEQEIVKIEEHKLIESHLRFLKPFKSESVAFIETTPAEEGTKVTWGFHGIHKVPFNVMMNFYNMDKAVGKDFEEGLADLKVILENK